MGKREAATFLRKLRAILTIAVQRKEMVMVPNQRADSSACLSLRSLRLNEARFNSLERVKSEGRKKAETRRPKPESPSASGFGLRISELGLLSALGLRASDFKATSPPEEAYALT